MSYSKTIAVRWSDLDPNFHVRHSAYYDMAAYCRIAWLNEAGLTAEKMKELNIGPVLFREECQFKRELKFGDELTVNLQLIAANKSFSRWTMQHEIWKDGQTLCAVVTLEGAWINTEIRKLTLPPKFLVQLLQDAPRTPDFVLLP